MICSICGSFKDPPKMLALWQIRESLRKGSPGRKPLPRGRMLREETLRRYRKHFRGDFRYPGGARIPR